MNLLLSDLFPEELDTLGLLLAARVASTRLSELEVKFVDLALCSSLACLLVLQLSLNLLEAAL